MKEENEERKKGVTDGRGVGLHASGLRSMSHAQPGRGGDRLAQRTTGGGWPAVCFGFCFFSFLFAAVGAVLALAHPSWMHQPLVSRPSNNPLQQAFKRSNAGRLSLSSVSFVFVSFVSRRGRERGGNETAVVLLPLSAGGGVGGRGERGQKKGERRVPGRGVRGGERRPGPERGAG